MKCNKLVLAISAALVGISQAYAGNIEFTEVPVPITDAEKRQINASPSAVVDGRTVNVGFHEILRSGDIKGGIYGQIFDINGQPLKAADGSNVISNDNDFASLLKGRHGGLYMVSHFESRPAAMYLTKLQQKRNGELVPVRTRALDFSHVNGGWVHCAGSVTPWGSHLGSEEYEPDAKQWRDNKVDSYNAAMAAYFGAAPAEAINVMNPYDYGYVVEVKVDSFEDAAVVKHYAMGRIAFELAYVMPDERTAYMSDDGGNVGLFRFVADEKGDLSAGTLWAAQWNQKSGEGMGSAKINWVSLGHATNAQVKEWIGKYKFADIFDEVAPANGTCEAGYKSINATKHQCLKLRDVNTDGVINATDEAIASRLETRRWAAMEGATTEWNKMEGITFNAEAGQLYIAMSDISKGMEDNKGSDVGGPNSIRVAKNSCGGVYALDVDGGYTATNMYPLVAGIPKTYPAGDVFQGNSCDVNGLANPDNITYLPGYNTLIIGEDTGSGHQNDMIWSFNLDNKKLTRIQTTPYGSETTSPYFYPDLNGHAYIMSVVQHPYGESDSDKLENPGQARGYTGYIGPFPKMDGEHRRHWQRH
ncbi:MAG: alkaline phosphatase PhoX [Pseudomonadota bacterium]